MAKGERYEVLVGLTYPTTTDPEVWERLWAGDTVTPAERKSKRVEAGAVVTDIPERSIPWLLEQGIIHKPVKATAEAPAASAATTAWAFEPATESEAE